MPASSEAHPFSPLAVPASAAPQVVPARQASGDGPTLLAHWAGLSALVPDAYPDAPVFDLREVRRQSPPSLEGPEHPTQHRWPGDPGHDLPGPQVEPTVMPGACDHAALNRSALQLHAHVGTRAGDAEYLPFMLDQQDGVLPRSDNLPSSLGKTFFVQCSNPLHDRLLFSWVQRTFKDRLHVAARALSTFVRWVPHHFIEAQARIDRF